MARRKDADSTATEPPADADAPQRQEGAAPGATPGTGADALPDAGSLPASGGAPGPVPAEPAAETPSERRARLPAFEAWEDRTLAGDDLLGERHAGAAPGSDAPGADGPDSAWREAEGTVPADGPAAEAPAPVPVPGEAPAPAPGGTAPAPVPGEAPAPAPGGIAPVPGRDEDPAAVPEPAPAPAGPAAHRAPEPAPVAAAPAPTAAEHEEHGPSVAGRILTWLFFLVAGGALFLWAGPRIAPHLPAGLEPVRAWLTPGATEQAEELAALRADLLARIEAIQPGMRQVDVEALVAARVSAAVAKSDAERGLADDALAARITQLADQVAAADSSAVEQRLAAAEARAAGLAAELGELKRQLAGVAQNGGGELSEEAVRRIAAHAADVEGLRGEFADLAAQIGALRQRIDEVEAASLRREAEAAAAARAVSEAAEARRRAALLDSALADLAARIESGEPFAETLAALAELSGAPVPPALTEAALRGVPTAAALAAAFPDAAHAAIRASIRPEPGAGFLDRAVAFLESQVATRSLVPREGTDTDAVLSRLEARLREGRLDLALAEAGALAPEARAPLADWLEALARRDAALRALAEYRAAVPVTN